MRGVLDTSVILGPPSRALPDESTISVISLAEIKLGVLVASNAIERAKRLARLVEVERTYSPLPVDDDVASAYATIVAAERERGRRPRAMDALIAATAVANDLTLYTRDEGLAGIQSVRVELIR